MPSRSLLTELCQAYVEYRKCGHFNGVPQISQRALGSTGRLNKWTRWRSHQYHLVYWLFMCSSWSRITTLTCCLYAELLAKHIRRRVIVEFGRTCIFKVQLLSHGMSATISLPKNSSIRGQYNLPAWDNKNFQKWFCHQTAYFRRVSSRKNPISTSWIWMS